MKNIFLRKIQLVDNTQVYELEIKGEVTSKYWYSHNGLAFNTNNFGKEEQLSPKAAWRKDPTLGSVPRRGPSREVVPTPGPKYEPLPRVKELSTVELQDFLDILSRTGHFRM